MKVLDLRCGHGHVFEGWFGSEEDFVSQRERQLIACPLCADTAVERLPSAPRLSLGAAQPAGAGAAGREAPVPAVTGDDAAGQSPQQRLQALWLKAARRVLETTEDVGERFADEARRIHAGSAPERGIRGQATPADAQALRDEGIEVFSMPLPVPPKRSQH